MKSLLTHRALHSHQQLLIAFSGGLDSTVLLHQLYQLRDQYDLTLRAIHVHHGLSHNADAWVAHCQQVCSQLAIPLQVEYVHLAEKGGVESAARTARYQAIAQALLPGEALVTAHHQDDQCETLLLAIKRGSGPAGMASMPECRPFAGSAHLRPLLKVKRAELLAYAQQHQLRYIDDESNQDARFDRNFLRLKVLPILAARWPWFVKTAARSAELCAEQEQLLDELLAPELQALLSTTQGLMIEPMMAMSVVKRNALLRRWLLQSRGVIPSKEQLDNLWAEVALSRLDATPALMIGGSVIRRYQGQLYCVRPYQGQRDTVLAWEDWQNPLPLPDDLGTLSLQATQQTTALSFRPPLDNETVSIRFSVAGKLAIQGRHGRRSLKKLWQELQVAPWRRENTPILFYNEIAICALGCFVTQEGALAGTEYAVDAYQLILDTLSR